MTAHIYENGGEHMYRPPVSVLGKKSKKKIAIEITKSKNKIAIEINY
jgi:hypothetical protein